MFPGAIPEGADWLSHVKPVLEKRMQKLVPKQFCNYGIIVKKKQGASSHFK